MYLLLTDETNINVSGSSRFFAYGGLIVAVDKIPKLHNAIDSIRQEAGYGQSDLLKFDTNTRPPQISHEIATISKKRALLSSIEFGCKFIVLVVLHDIAIKRQPNELVTWGANEVIGKFNSFLQCLDSHGIVVVDRLPAKAEYRYLVEKFCHGLKMTHNRVVPLDRINLFASSCINASHLSSVMDIVLGSFRYCINSPSNLIAAKEMMKSISELLWCDRIDNRIKALEKGLIFRPKKVRNQSYHLEYDNLLDHINSLLQ